MAYYLAIDLGTTGCRSILLDQTLKIVGEDYQEYGLITPYEKWVEQDAELWWEMTVQTVKAAIGKSHITGKEIRGIGISSQGITIVPVDEQGMPLCNAISWLDTRSDQQLIEIEKKISFREMFTLTGKRMDSAYTLPKILWLKEHRPEIFQKAHKFLMPMDFLIGKLTGNPVTDHSMASGTLMYDIKRSCWSDSVLDMFDIPKQKLPEILRSGEIAGTVMPEVARMLGISEDCVVAVGAQDQKCAALGAGLKNGTMTVSLGTAAAVEKLWLEPKTEGDTRIGWSSYIHQETWVTEGVISTAASVLRWLRDTMFVGMRYEQIDQEAQEALKRGSSLLCFPYLGGPSDPNNYPDSIGCFYGISLATQRGDFALAVMEGVAFQLRSMLEVMDAYGKVDQLVLFGGGSKSDLWCRLIANITGMTITVPQTPEVAAAGAAILTSLACKDSDRQALPYVPSRKTYAPSPEKKEYYKKKYEKYTKIEKRLWEN